jgi:hypothetical protein
MGTDGTGSNGAGSSDPDGTRCPICGKGDLVEIAYQAAGEFEPSLQPDSVEVQVFSCGHRVPGAQLSVADPERLNVERRTSEDTVDPVPDDTGAAGDPSQTPPG